MKLSGILRAILVTIFWVAVGLFVHWFFELENPVVYTIIMSGATPLGAFFARFSKNKGFSFLFHLLVLAIPGIFAVTELIEIPVMLYGMGIVIISYIAKLAESKVMDSGNGFGCLVLVALYLVGSLMEYSMIWAHFGIMVTYIFLLFAESNIEKSEEYIEKSSYHAVVDIKKLSGISNTVVFIVTLAMLVICLLCGLLGKIGIFAVFSAFLQSKWKQIFKFIKRIKFRNNDGIEVPDEEIPAIPPEEQELFDDANLQYVETNMSDIIITAFIFALCITAVLYVVYAFLKKMYKKYMKFKTEGVVEEHLDIKKEKKVKENPAAEDKYYNNRTAIRKIYKKRIKGNRRGRREDFNNCTPMEQRIKSNLDGNEISTEMIDLYEKARYSSEEITKNDVKNMNKI